MKEAWSETEAIAWIIYRRLKAVEHVGENLPGPGDKARPSTVMVIAAARKLPFQTKPHRKPDKRVRAADRLLQWAEARRGLAPDQQGYYRADAVKRVFPTQEGRGLGQKKPAYPHQWKIHRLGLYMLTNPRPDRMEDLYDQCLDGTLGERLLGRREQFAPLCRKALAWAEEELAARVRIGVGVPQAVADDGETPIPLTDEARKKCQANLRGWKQPSRGWKNRSNR